NWDKLLHKIHFNLVSLYLQLYRCVIPTIDTAHIIPITNKFRPKKEVVLYYFRTLVCAILSDEDRKYNLQTLCSNTILFLYSVQQNSRSEEHTSELQSRFDLVCRL